MLIAAKENDGCSAIVTKATQQVHHGSASTVTKATDRGTTVVPP